MPQQNRPKPVVLTVIDGWGIAPSWGGNAVSLAKTPFMNMAWQTYPHAVLGASGVAVGLPEKERGNSEVGHLNIGAGQIVHQSFPSITSAIKDGSFFKSEALVKAFNNAKQNSKAVHIIGLTSDGGIHSHIDHLFALLDMGQKLGSTDIVIHAITDGRDTPPFAAQEYISHINTSLNKFGFGRIGTVEGRYYAMDRDHRWERIEKVYRAMTEGVGKTSRSAEGAVAMAYRDGYSDEFIPPTVVQGENNSFRTIQDGDSIIFFNFRGDRARELTQAFVSPEFKGFGRKKVLKNITFVGFTFYQEGLPMEVAFSPSEVKKPLSAVISEANLKQLHVAESEKYAHVTYFFNGGQEVAYAGEDRIVVPSPKAASYDQVPEMASPKITETVIKNLQNYDFIILNYACPDMVGHTGNLRATIKACEAVEKGLKEIYEKINPMGGLLVITADHGNAEQMVNPKTGESDTEHSNNPVPFILAGDVVKQLKINDKGSLSDVAPTILEIMGIAPSSDMTGKSLIIK
ncbi:2,3-bisphosphoglycerate-independent phosphoglycerate mutase [Candidatus Berkelbacteria bacterium]|nr:2,3-bisphosphoglycerate-independent phosphoglycerate mutase [Candidatus Berkelbacteria bacterium]